MTHRYGTFDTRTANAEFLGFPFQYGYINHMRLTDVFNIIYFGKGHEMFNVLYRYTDKIISIERKRSYIGESPVIELPVVLTRDERHVTQQVMDYLREENRLEQFLMPTKNYTRASESLTYDKALICTLFDITEVPFDEIEFTARFNAKRVACEYTIHLENDETIWDLEMEMQGNAFIARDPIDDNHFRREFKGEVPSIIDMVKIYIEVFRSDLYKVRYAKPVEQSADTVTGGS